MTVDRDRIEAWARDQRATLVGRAYLVSDDEEVEELADWIANVVEQSGCVATGRPHEQCRICDGTGLETIEAVAGNQNAHYRECPCVEAPK